MTAFNKLTILGVPFWLGQRKYGPNLGPDAVRAAGLADKFAALDIDYLDEGNLSLPDVAEKGRNSTVRNLKAVAAASEATAKAVSDIVAAGRKPFILGGDHSVAIGTIAGIASHYENLGVIWYDAHGDLNTPDTSPTGNIHGMPLAACLGLGHSELVRVGGYAGKIKPENIVLIGVRDLDAGEVELISRLNIKVYTAADVHRLGISNVIEETIAYLAGRCDGIHLSFDLDGIDPLEAPGVGTPVEQGISLADSITALQIFHAFRCISSVEFVEINPLLDEGNTTAKAAVTLAAALCGGDAGALLGHLPAAGEAISAGSQATAR